jgi:hypothetical protein
MSAGRLVIRRPRGKWIDVLRAYRILVDGAEIGRLRRGGTLSLMRPEGPALVEARIDWCSAAPLRIVISSKADVVVEVVNTRGIAGAMVASEVTDPGTYLTLTQLAPPVADAAGPWG